MASLVLFYTAHRDLVNRLVDLLGCTRFQAVMILRAAVREGYAL